MDETALRALFPEDATAPQTEDVTIPARDGFPLRATLHAPRGDARAIVVVNSATGVRRGHYARFADFLARRGYTVITYDYRGIGDSRPPVLRGFRARMRTWGEDDFEGVLRWAATRAGSAKLFVVGHSVGGQLIGLAESNARIDGLVTVGSQLGDFRNWPAPARYRIAFMWYVAIPAITSAFGYLPGALGIGEDLPAGVAHEWARWGRTEGALVGGRHHGRREGFARVRSPVRAYSFSDDDYAPRLAVERLHALLTNAVLERRHVQPKDVGVKAIGHFGFFRSAFRATLWAEAGAFFDRIVDDVRQRRAS
jgi:predicted alpha/beta hydrolase